MKKTETKSVVGVKKTVRTKRAVKPKGKSTKRKAIESQEAVEQYGELLSAHTNLRLKLDVMLGQILKALYIVGIGPDEITKKCTQMFQKREQT